MKKLLISFLSVFSFAGAAFAFTDVDANYHYNTAVDYIQAAGIVDGYADGTFRPDQKINRAELLKIIVESKYTQEEISTALDEYRANNYWYVDLPDVLIDEWYGPYVRIAVRDGIIQGYDDNTFRGANNVNFVEALKIMMVANAMPYDTTTAVWYEDLVNSASSANLIPLDITAFDFEITRGQMADMITRTLKFQDGSLTDYLGSASVKKQAYSDIEAGQSNLSVYIDAVADMDVEIVDDIPFNDGGDDSDEEVVADEDEEVEEEVVEEEQKEEIIMPEGGIEAGSSTFQHLDALATALELHHQEYGSYPGSFGQASCLKSNFGAGNDLKVYFSNEEVPSAVDSQYAATLGGVTCTGTYYYMRLNSGDYLLAAGLPEPDLANMLGEELSDVGLISHLTPEKLADEIENFDNLLFWQDGAIDDMIYVQTN